MRIGFLSFGMLIAVALFAGTAQAQETKQDQKQESKQEFLKQGDVISGQVRAVHRNNEPVYQIVSDAPKQFAHKDACKGTPKTFHLAETDNKAKTIRLKRSVGQKVEIVADDFTCAQTIAHTGDAIVTKWRFTGPPPR
jgi:exosome complex RNA-binding protein Rrp4